MPPSAREIKARLDDAIDSEGNVLDMATVLELVTTLEKTHLSKEALETTRIGKVINLMRKKTENEVLATRAKKLVKKWQKLVNNHFKQLKQSNSPHSNSPVAPVNGINKKNLLQDRPRSCPDLPSKPEGLHKQLLKERCGSPAAIVGIQSCNSLNDNKPTTLKRTNSPLNGDQQTCVEPLQDTESTIQEITLVKDTNTLQSNSHNIPIPKLEGIDINSNDGKDELPNNNSEPVECLPKELHSDNTISEPTIEPSAEEQYVVVPFVPRFEIPPENLRVERKLPGDIDTTELEAEVDGINGCYDHTGTWCQWTDVMMTPNDTLHVLPYINLE